MTREELVTEILGLNEPIGHLLDKLGRMPETTRVSDCRGDWVANSNNCRTKTMSVKQSRGGERIIADRKNAER
jgi:hypothetical protein